MSLSWTINIPTGELGVQFGVQANESISHLGEYGDILMLI